LPAIVVAAVVEEAAALAAELAEAVVVADVSEGRRGFAVFFAP